MIKGGLQDRQEKGEESPRSADKVFRDLAEDVGKTKNRMDARLASKADDELAELRRRIEACRGLRPPKGIHDGASWGYGRDAVIRVLLAEE